MTRKRRTVELIEEIRPDRVYRTTLSEELFGYGPQAAREKARNGELPLSFPLSPSSRFEVWTGQQVLDHRARMKELAEEKAKAEFAAAKDQPPKPQPAGLAAAQKIKKVKLRPPAKLRQRESA